MVTAYMTSYGVSRAQAISDLDDIESGRAAPPESMDIATYSDILDKSKGELEKKGIKRFQAFIGGVAATFVSGLVLAGVIFSGAVTDSYGNFPRMATSTMLAASAATTTACDFTNSGTEPRIWTDAGFYLSTSTSGGSIAFNVGTSTAAGTTSTSPVVNSVYTVGSSVVALSTTSSLQTAKAIWLPGEHIVFKTNSTTHVGSCRVTWE